LCRQYNSRGSTWKPPISVQTHSAGTSHTRERWRWEKVKREQRLFPLGGASSFFADQRTKIWRSTSLEECVGREQMFDIRAKGGQAITTKKRTLSNDDHGVTAPHCHYGPRHHAIIVAHATIFAYYLTNCTLPLNFITRARYGGRISISFGPILGVNQYNL
jgi:hypothetical protein